jgi:diguanylate cyclase (GGDEF)-like protein/PAS domain S-box-containing protein
MADSDCATKLEASERLMQSLLEQKNREELIDLPWAGNLGTWIWDVPSNRVVCNHQKVLNLGYALDEIPDPLGYEFFTELLHPGDYEPVMEQMRRHLRGIDPVYEVQYRIRHKNGHYRWYYDRGRITKLDEQGKPLQLVGIVFDITEQKQMEEQLKHMVDHDALTGILSRRALFTYLERLSSPFWVLMIDIDHFKQINDTYGHTAGDTVLVEVAQRIRQTIGEEDVCGRYGGEEFLVILTNRSSDAAFNVANHIRSEIATYPCNGAISVTISGGLAEAGDLSTDNLLILADKRLYQAKKQGRNCIVGPEF